MKVCLLFQRRFTRVAHQIAIRLKEQYGVNEFCGYVYLRSSYKFLQEQRDINYSALLLDQDIHEKYKNEKLDWNYIDSLEKEYGIPNLWKYIEIDRVLRYNLAVREYPHDKSPFTHEELARIVQVTAREIIQFLEQEKPDVIFLPVISALGNMLLFEIAKKKGIKVLVGAETRINQGYILSNSYKKFNFAEERFEELLQTKVRSLKFAEAKEYIDNYRSNPSPYLYMMKDGVKIGRRKELKWLSPKPLIRSLRWFLTLTLGSFFKKNHDYDSESAFNYFFDRFRRKIRSFIGYKDLYGDCDSKIPYVFYPLHLEPEIATLLLSPFWTDQINLIKQIAKSLPFKFKLYVKDHPVMVGYRTRSYYKELKKIPNVVLLDPSIKSYDIISSAKLIVTISGTAGWEGLIFKKPVITFGDVYYNALSMVKKCTVIEELPELVKIQLDEHKHSEDELIIFISSLLENSAEVALHEIWEKGLEKSEENKKLDIFTKLLAKHLGLVRS